MSRKKNIVYVGGLDDQVSQEILFAAFIPFGEVKSVQVMRDYVANKSRGFGFVEFDCDEDAQEAIFNMDGAELFGKFLRCTNAKAASASLQEGKAVWSSEEWMQNSINNDSAPMITDKPDN